MRRIVSFLVAALLIISMNAAAFADGPVEGYQLESIDGYYQISGRETEYIRKINDELRTRLGNMLSMDLQLKAVEEPQFTYYSDIFSFFLHCTDTAGENRYLCYNFDANGAVVPYADVLAATGYTVSFDDDPFFRYESGEAYSEAANHFVGYEYDQEVQLGIYGILRRFNATNSRIFITAGHTLGMVTTAIKDFIPNSAEETLLLFPTKEKSNPSYFVAGSKYAPCIMGPRSEWLEETNSYVQKLFSLGHGNAELVNHTYMNGVHCLNINIADSYLIVVYFDDLGKLISLTDVLQAFGIPQDRYQYCAYRAIDRYYDELLEDAQNRLTGSELEKQISLLKAGKEKTIAEFDQTYPFHTVFIREDNKLVICLPCFTAYGENVPMDLELNADLCGIQTPSSTTLSMNMASYQVSWNVPSELKSYSVWEKRVDLTDPVDGWNIESPNGRLTLNLYTIQDIPSYKESVMENQEKFMTYSADTYQIEEFQQTISLIYDVDIVKYTFIKDDVPVCVYAYIYVDNGYQPLCLNLQLSELNGTTFEALLSKTLSSIQILNLPVFTVYTLYDQLVEWYDEPYKENDSLSYETGSIDLTLEPGCEDGRESNPVSEIVVSVIPDGYLWDISSVVTVYDEQGNAMKLDSGYYAHGSYCPAEETQYYEAYYVHETNGYVYFRFEPDGAEFHTLPINFYPYRPTEGPSH